MSNKIGQCHPIARTVDVNIRDIAKIPVRLKLQLVHTFSKQIEPPLIKTK